MEDIRVRFGSTPDKKYEDIDRFLESSIRCVCAGREIVTSCMRISQEIKHSTWKACLELLPNDDLIRHRIRKGIWPTGSAAEGLPRSVVGDMDTMFTQYTWPDIVLQLPENTTPQLSNGLSLGNCFKPV